MKLRFIITKIILAFFAVQMTFSQTENVGIGTTSPDNSALLHLDVSAMATKRGLLIPKVTSAQRTAISNPANGLLIFDTDDNRFYYNAGTPATPNWVAFVATNSTFPFNLLSSGTNTTATMLVGTGASLAPTGTGFIQANRFVGTGSTSDAVDLATGEVNGILPLANGGTGLSTIPSNGQILIGNGTSYSLNTITGGTGINVSNGAGTITLTADAGNLTTTTTGVTITGGTNAVLGSGTSINIATADASNTGLLSSADWNTFNNKQNAITQGNLTTTTSGITITGGTNAVIGGGTTINIATADVTNTGLLTSSDWTTFNNKLGSGSAAGGDLAGTYPNPTVDGLQGYAVSNAAPSNGQVLKWNGSEWTPSTDNNTNYTAGNGIDISGTTISVDFAGSGTANTASRSDHNHTGVYEPVLTKGDITTTTSGITITGGTNAVIGGGTTINIATADGTNTGLLTNTDWTTFNNKLGSGSAAGGDLAGTYPNPTVDGLQGYAVSNTAPSNGQVLKWNGTAWTPSTDETSGLDAGNGIDITGTTISVLFAGSGTANTAARSDHNHDGTYEYPLTFSSPLSRTGNTISIPQANGSTNGYLSSTDWTTFNNKLSSSLTDSYIFVGNGSDVATGVALSGDATITNAGALTVTAIQNRAISTTAPSNGQVLTWNNALSQWEPQSVGGSTGWSLSGNTLSGTEILGSTNNQPLSIVTNNAERLRIAAGGNIGLGYNDPKVIFHQDQGDATATYHKFTAGTTTGQSATDGFDIGIDASGNAILNQRENLNLQVSTNNSERMRILGNGKVLIATTTEPDDTVRVRIGGDVLIDQDLIVEGNIDPEAVIFKQRTQAPGTATEGMVYYNATEKKLKVHDGTDFQDVAGGPVVVRAYLGSSLTLSTSFSSINFNSEIYDTHNSFSNNEFVAPMSGYYDVNIMLLTSNLSSGANSFEFRIEKNGSTLYTYSFSETFSALVPFNFSIIDMIYLNKDEYLTFSIRRSTTNATSIQSGSDKSFITIHLIK